MMIASPPSAYSGGGSRRNHYSRSPLDNGPRPKRSKLSNSIDPYERNYGGNGLDQSSFYTAICVKNITPMLSDQGVRELCHKRFSKFGLTSIRVHGRNQDRIAFITFSNYKDAREARHSKFGLVWENMQVIVQPVYSRIAVPHELPLKPRRSRERSPPNRRRHGPTPPNPLPPPISSHQRSSRRQYTPYIPLPPDLVQYSGVKSNRQRKRSSSSTRAHRYRKMPTLKPRRSRTPRDSRMVLSRSPSPSRTSSNNESTIQNEPTRTLIVENLERTMTEAKLQELFGRYGLIKQIDLKKSSASSSSSKRASIQYENVDMAYEARRSMNGQLIGKCVCRISYGKSTPTKHLWVGNIPVDIKRRDLEHAFARYGQIKTLDYSTGDPTAVISYCDTDAAVRARTKLSGTIKFVDGRVVYSEINASPSSRNGFRIDYLDRPTSRRFVIVRPQKKSSRRTESRSLSRSKSRHSSSASSARERSPSPSNESNDDNPPATEDILDNVKTETRSRSPTPPLSSIIKQRRSTESSQTPSLSTTCPVAGRAFHGPLGSYLSTNDTENVNSLNDLMILCEQLNASATKNNTALSTVYPVQFILKSHAYDARLHFLAGSPTLASILLGQPGDLIAAKTELKITQRLRFDPTKLDDLERKLRSSVTNALAIATNNSHANSNGFPSNGFASVGTRKHGTAANQTKFSILIASPKLYSSNEISVATEQQQQPQPQQQQPQSASKVKCELTSPQHVDEQDKQVEVKQEKVDDPENHSDNDDDDTELLSCLIAYLVEKEAAGVITMPFHPTYQNDHSSRQETAVIHIFPSCQFTKKILKILCPSIHFLNAPHKSPLSGNKTINDDHLMVVIVHND